MEPVSLDAIHAPTRESPVGATIHHPVLMALVSLELGLLAVQFALGMFVNLYVTFPSPVVGMYGMMQLMFQPGMGSVMAHMMAGMVLGALTLLTFAASALSRNTLLVATTGGTFAAVVAGESVAWSSCLPGRTMPSRTGCRWASCSRLPWPF